MCKGPGRQGPIDPPHRDEDGTAKNAMILWRWYCSFMVQCRCAPAKPTLCHSERSEESCPTLPMPGPYDITRQVLYPSNPLSGHATW